MRAPRWDAQGLSAHGLLALVEAILSNLAAALTLPPTSPRAYLHLLPTALSLLGPMDHCELLAANGTTLADGAAVVAYAVAGLRSQPWAAPSLVPLATMLRDITLPEAARRELVLQLTGRFDELEPTQMPALVYQMLLLADTDSKAHVLRALNAHFAGRDSDAWMLVQGTVILHIQFAVKQDQPLGNAVLKQVKGGQMPLGAFSFALLLSLARVGERFHDAVRARERGGGGGGRKRAKGGVRERARGGEGARERARRSASPVLRWSGHRRLATLSVSPLTLSRHRLCLAGPPASHGVPPGGLRAARVDQRLPMAQ